MSKNTEQLEMGNRRSRSPAHESATQTVAPKPADAGWFNDRPFVADQLNIERRVVLQLREDDGGSSKIHAAFDIFNVAINVSSFCPRPPFKLQAELLKSFKDYVFKGKVLTTADRYALSRVTIVGNNFLRDTDDEFDDFCSRCSGLKAIDLSPLCNVTTVGDDFLSYCDGLNTIYLSPLSNLTYIGANFLNWCSGLKTIDLTPLSKLRTIGIYFLYCCKGHNTIDLSPLSNLTTVGVHFLSGCDGLKTIDLSPLSNLTTVGDQFLYGCTRLKTIDVSPLSKLRTIGANFLCGDNSSSSSSSSSSGSGSGSSSDDWFP